MSYYNLTNATAVNPFTHLTVINNITGGILGILLLCSVYLVMMIMFRNQGTKTSVSVAGFLTAFTGILLWSAGLIAFTYVLWAFLAFVISLLIAIFAD
jgi:hypothetical protein